MDLEKKEKELLESKEKLVAILNQIIGQLQLIAELKKPALVEDKKEDKK